MAIHFSDKPQLGRDSRNNALDNKLMSRSVEMIGPIMALGKLSVRIEPEKTSAMFEGGIEHV
jgi:hypothetical protein